MVALLASLSRSKHAIEPGLNSGVFCPPLVAPSMHEDSWLAAAEVGVTRGDRGGDGLSRVMTDGLGG